MKNTSENMDNKKSSHGDPKRANIIECYNKNLGTYVSEMQKFDKVMNISAKFGSLCWKKRKLQEIS